MKLIKIPQLLHIRRIFFRIIEIGGKDNQCLQFALNAFYKDVDDLKHATVLWNLVKWLNTTIMRCNDNAFVYNRILGYNTACYDLDTNYWYWDEVHFQATTCYIKFSTQHYDYIQPLRPQTISLDTINNKEQIIPIDPINDKEIILPIAKVFPSAPILEGIVK